MYILGNGRLITRSQALPYLENGAVCILSLIHISINRCELINHGVLPDPEPAEKDEQTGIL